MVVRATSSAVDECFFSCGWLLGMFYFSAIAAFPHTDTKPLHSILSNFYMPLLSFKVNVSMTTMAINYLDMLSTTPKIDVVMQNYQQQQTLLPVRCRFNKLPETTQSTIRKKRTERWIRLRFMFCFCFWSSRWCTYCANGVLTFLVSSECSNGFYVYFSIYCIVLPIFVTISSHSFNNKLVGFVRWW